MQLFICRMREFDESEALAVQKVDEGCKTRWNWSWLQVETEIEVKTAKHKFKMSDFFKKKLKKGYAKCTVCMKEINYGNKGVHALLKHCQSAIHTQRVATIISTQSVAQLLCQDKPASSQIRPPQQTE